MTNEKRLIDADALLDEFLKRYTERERNGNLVFAACEIKQDFADMISNFPTVDAVEVVRCLECHCYTPVDEYTGKCVFLIGEHQYVVPDGYCYLGERKEGAE